MLLIACVLYDAAASRIDNEILPKSPHPRTQRAQRKPCRKSAICRTTLQHCSYHTYLPGGARSPACYRSFLTASPGHKMSMKFKCIRSLHYGSPRRSSHNASHSPTTDSVRKGHLGSNVAGPH